MLKLSCCKGGLSVQRPWLENGKEYERVGDDWVLVEVRDPKQRSEEEKKIVYFEKQEKVASRDDRKSWLQARLQKAGLSKETAAAMAEAGPYTCRLLSAYLRLNLSFFDL